LNSTADHVEAVLEHGVFSLREIKTLVGVVFGMNSVYRRGARRKALERSTPAQREQLEQAENRIREARGAVREAYRARREKARLEEELEPAELVRLEDKQRGLETLSRVEHMDTGT